VVSAAATVSDPKKKKKTLTSAAWKEAKALIWARRGRLSLGLALMLVNRLAGLVLPATSKFLIDDVIGKRRAELLIPLAVAAGAATLVQAVSSFALSQVLGVAAQRAITDMRRRVEAHVARLPINYFDSTQSGVLISRIMTDAEGIRNLVGTGLVQLTGSVITALFALAYLFYLNWYLTCITIVALATFGGAMALAFTLREIDGLSSEEVCDVLNISRCNLWSLLHHARMKLRNSLEAELIRGEPPKFEPTSGGIAKQNGTVGTARPEKAVRSAQARFRVFVRFPKVLRLIGWS